MELTSTVRPLAVTNLAEAGMEIGVLKACYEVSMPRSARSESRSTFPLSR